MDADTLDVCKENIQPLRKGRVAAQLGVALQAQTDTEVHKQLLEQRERYEVLIRMYDGPDPLEPRYAYVSWIEQAYPKHGPESNLVPLLEDTIMTFKDDDRYKQDPRFVDLIVKYIETQESALELYQMVYSQGLGTMCALLYKSWAEELDRANDVKRANQIFQLGIANRAQPLEMLKQAHLMFQLSVGRRMLYGEDMNRDDVEAEGSRQALTKLKKAGPVRKPHGFPGTLPLSSSSASNTKKNNTPIAVYQEDENGDPMAVPLPQSQLGSFVHSEKMHRENTMKAGTWNKPYNKKQFGHLPPPAIPTTPSFKVHIDIVPDEETPSRPIADVPNALRPKRADTFTCPMAIFEPPDPTVKPMYCKSKVYAGGSEFSLEEIRAAVYLKKYEEERKIDELKALGVYQPEFETTKSVFHPPSVQPMTPVAYRLPQDNECHTILKATEGLRLCDTLPRTKIVTRFTEEPDTPRIDSQPPSTAKTTSKINKKLHFDVFNDRSSQPTLVTLSKEDGTLPLEDDAPKPQFSIICDDAPQAQPKPKVEVFVDDSPKCTKEQETSSLTKTPSVPIFNDEKATGATSQISHKTPSITIFNDDPPVISKFSKTPKVFVDDLPGPAVSSVPKKSSKAPIPIFMDEDPPKSTKGAPKKPPKIGSTKKKGFSIFTD